jgi:hypothetical protein
MDKFEPGVMVIVADNNILRRGIVKDVFEGLSVAIVDFGEGCVEKIRFYQMALDPGIQEKTSKSVKKSEITITPGEFSLIAMKVLTDILGDTGARIGNIVTLFPMIITRLHKALFFEGDND